MARWGGAAAAVVLAVAAYLAGALPSGDPAPTLRLEGLGSTSTAFQIGLALWFVATAAMCVIWWRGRRITVVAGINAQDSRHNRDLVGKTVGLAALAAFPLLLAPPLASRDVYAYACQGDLWLAGLDPYELGVADGGCPWTPSVPSLWWHTPAPYGPLAIVLSGAAAGIGRLLSGDTDTQLLIAVTVLRLIALGGVALVAWGMMRLRPGALWAGLVTPLVAIHAVSGAHNDALVAGLVVAGLAFATSRRRADWLLAGVLLAGAVAVKVTALAAVPFALLLVRGWRPRGLVAVTGAATFAALSLASGLGLGWVKALTNTGDLQQWTSLPTGAGMAAGYVLRGLGLPGAMSASVTTARVLGLVALAAIGLYALRRAWNAEERTVLAAAGWVLAAVALLGPVFYPWYALAPLAVLACAGAAWERTRAAVTVALCFLVLPNGLGLAVLTKGPGAFLSLGIVITLLIWAFRARPRATA